MSVVKMKPFSMMKWLLPTSATLPIFSLSLPKTVAPGVTRVAYVVFCIGGFLPFALRRLDGSQGPCQRASRRAVDRWPRRAVARPAAELNGTAAAFEHRPANKSAGGISQ